jgi:hypothetical protein
MTRLAPFAMLLSAAAFAAAAEPVRPAQDPTPLHQYPPALSTSPDELAVQAIHNYGACVVSQTPQGARAALALDFRTAEYREKIRAVAKGHADRCDLPGWRLGFDPVLFAGAMAEALLKNDVGMAQLPGRLAYDPARQEIVSRGPLEDMALCTAVRAPDATAALFATDPGSGEEARAMQALQPMLEDCLVKGAKVGLNSPAVRSLLALAAYRVVTTPRKTA